MKHLIVEVIQVKGKCAAGYNVGDKFEVNKSVCIDGSKICYFAVSSIMPVLLALQLGNNPKDIGLSNEDGVAYMQCSDIGYPFTPGGSVIFKISSKF